MKTQMADNPDFASSVKERDGRICVKCGYKPSSGTNLHAHHINPKDNGGCDEIQNGATLCAKCHKFAPDWNTVISDDSYRRAFEVYRSTMNPPAMDLFWFGMMAEQSDHTSAESMFKSTLYEELPNLNLSNWWMVAAAFADYKDVRTLLPLKWDWSEGGGVQCEL